MRTSVATRHPNRFRPMLESCEDRTVPTPVVSVEAIADAHEGGSSGTFRFTRSETTGTLSVGVTLGGTATPWTDYTPPFAVNFADGSATVDVTVPTANDAVSEPTETVTFTLQVGVDYTIGAPDTATISIFDNDAQYVSVEAISDAAEGGTAGQFLFTRTGDLSSSLSANFSVGGTATSGTDFTALGSAVNFAAGSSAVSVNVAALADNVVEGDETVTATVTSGTGYSVGSSSSASVTITDDPPVIEVSATDTTEGGSAGGFTFTRTGGDVTSSLTVYYAVGGTATEGDDYSALSGSVTFSANSSTASVTLTPVDDSDVEFNETVVAYIVPDDGYTIGDDDSASATIHDNETPIVSVSQNSDALEGGDPGHFGSCDRVTSVVP